MLSYESLYQMKQVNFKQPNHHTNGFKESKGTAMHIPHTSHYEQ